VRGTSFNLLQGEAGNHRRINQPTSQAPPESRASNEADQMGKVKVGERKLFRRTKSRRWMREEGRVSLLFCFFFSSDLSFRFSGVLCCVSLVVHLLFCLPCHHRSRTVKRLNKYISPPLPVLRLAENHSIHFSQ
jgi:hypothetical protein